MGLPKRRPANCLRRSSQNSCRNQACDAEYQPRPLPAVRDTMLLRGGERRGNKQCGRGNPQTRPAVVEADQQAGSLAVHGAQLRRQHPTADKDKSACYARTHTKQKQRGGIGHDARQQHEHADQHRAADERLPYAHAAHQYRC